MKTVIKALSQDIVSRREERQAEGELYKSIETCRANPHNWVLRGAHDHRDKFTFCYDDVQTVNKEQAFTFQEIFFSNFYDS